MKLPCKILDLLVLDGYLEIIRGGITHIYAKNIGNDTNNVEKLSTLEKGLIIAKCLNYQKCIIEGDSRNIVLMIKKLQNGSNPTKASNR